MKYSVLAPVVHRTGTSRSRDLTNTALDTVRWHRDLDTGLIPCDLDTGLTPSGTGSWVDTGPGRCKTVSQTGVNTVRKSGDAAPAAKPLGVEPLSGTTWSKSLRDRSTKQYLRHKCQYEAANASVSSAAMDWTAYATQLLLQQVLKDDNSGTKQMTVKQATDTAKAYAGN